ncbi:MAG: hypothetical protein KDD01_19065 [Phaeodactylibacter sp.]|nr:hypothetical protein [Phaeodactylibacter sp.]
MTPHRSYIIWLVPRSGSTLLCKGLESTGIAGIPGEYFTLPTGQSLLGHHQVEDYESLKRKLWRLGTTPDGVFGIKYPMHTSRYTISPMSIIYENLINNFEATIW